MKGDRPKPRRRKHTCESNGIATYTAPTYGGGKIIETHCVVCGEVMHSIWKNPTTGQQRRAA